MDINLLKGDSFELIDTLPQGSIDCIITDPPYLISDANIGAGLNKRRNFLKEIDELDMCTSDIDIPLLLSKVVRLFKSKEHYSSVYFCSLKQLHLYINFAIENGFQYGVTIWHKSDPIPMCNNKYLNDIEFAVYIKGSKAKIYGSYQSKSLVYSSSTNRTDKQTYGHPTIKPISLMDKYVENHTLEGMTILDPFMGTGSTGVSCVSKNRSFVGIEKTDKWFDVATERINNSSNVNNNSFFE